MGLLGHKDVGQLSAHLASKRWGWGEKGAVSSHQSKLGERASSKSLGNGICHHIMKTGSSCTLCTALCHLPVLLSWLKEASHRLGSGYGF